MYVLCTDWRPVLFSAMSLFAVVCSVFRVPTVIFVLLVFKTWRSVLVNLVYIWCKLYHCYLEICSFCHWPSSIPTDGKQWKFTDKIARASANVGGEKGWLFFFRKREIDFGFVHCLIWFVFARRIYTVSVIPVFKAICLKSAFEKFAGVMSAWPGCILYIIVPTTNPQWNFSTSESWKTLRMTCGRSSNCTRKQR